MFKYLENTNIENLQYYTKRAVLSSVIASLNKDYILKVHELGIPFDYALYFAGSTGNMEILLYVLQFGANGHILRGLVDYTSDNVEMARFALQHKHYDQEEITDNARIAISNNNINVTNFLLEQGANPLIVIFETIKTDFNISVIERYNLLQDPNLLLAYSSEDPVLIRYILDRAPASPTQALIILLNLPQPLENDTDLDQQIENLVNAGADLNIVLHSDYANHNFDDFIRELRDMED